MVVLDLSAPELGTFAWSGADAAVCVSQVVHRDIKPENILIQGGKPGGKVYLTDFGGVQQSPAENTDEAEDIEMGTVVGTYGYMAPEQLRGAARPASDLFALGGTLLYLLSGTLLPCGIVAFVCLLV